MHSGLETRSVRFTTPQQMAEVSSHLRNFAVAEVIGFIAMLDGHPEIVGEPTAQKAAAGFQQTKGTAANPLAHAVPYKATRLSPFNSIFETTLFSRGRCRKAGWSSQSCGAITPIPNTRWRASRASAEWLDAIAERHRYGDGLVKAFEACGEAAVERGAWDGSGERKHDLASLTTFIGAIYESTWVPRARAAYFAARSYFANQLNVARSANSARLSVIEHRRDILEAQVRILENETAISPEAARNVWRFAATETWN